LNYVGFEVNVRNPQSCDRYVDASTATSFQSQCQRDQSVDRYVTDLYLARNAELQASSGVSSASDVIGVEIQRVLYYDSSTDTTSDVTTSYVANNCETTYYGDVRTSTGFVRTGQTCLFTSNSSWTSIDTSTANATSSVMFCANIVRDVVYYVNHSTTARGTIQQVLADVTITDLTATTASYPVVFAQSFAIEFTSANTAQQTTENGNLVTRLVTNKVSTRRALYELLLTALVFDYFRCRMRSGNPGYQQGLPVLSGQRNGSVIDQSKTGFSVPYSTSGSCPTTSDTIQTLATAFGYDTLTGCTLRLTRDELRDFCCTGASGACLANSFVAQVSTPSNYVDSATGLAHFLNVSQVAYNGVNGGYIGIYGDADPLDMSQWFPYATNFPTDARTWNDETSTCSNVYAGLSVQFLVANSAERANPQRKIVAALVEVVTSDWVFR
jgi:hypothetical protein